MSERKMAVWPEVPVKFSWRERITLFFRRLTAARLPSGEKIYFGLTQPSDEIWGLCPKTGKIKERIKIRDENQNEKR